MPLTHPRSETIVTEDVTALFDGDCVPGIGRSVGHHGSERLEADSAEWRAWFVACGSPEAILGSEGGHFE